jgi:tetratricopeptide (TPR) repeat protein
MKRCNQRSTVVGAMIAIMVLLMMMLGGCAGLSGTAKPNPKLAAEYLAKGQQLETQDDLVAAMEQYKLALTADPKNEAAMQSSQRLTDKLKKLADARYDLGMKYYRQGKYALARTQFLIALKYQPDHPGASRMLVSRQPEKAPDYVLYEIQPGESLSIIAKKYYGDYKKFDVIARYNGIEDATKVKPGQTIKIPNAVQGMLPATQNQDDLKNAEFVLHTVQPGQSISRLAQIYYGDYKKFHLIAQYNHMDDATQVKVGDVIKIPKVAGLPFNQPSNEPAQAATPTVQETTTNQAAAPVPAPAPEPQTEATPEPLRPQEPEKLTESDNEQALAYRDAGIELYNEGKYEDAIFELHKSVEAIPEDKQTRTYLSKAYFESGKSLLSQSEYDAAKEAFESALQFDPACPECRQYIEKSKIGPLMVYRNKGIDHFNRNEFADAITALTQYLDVRPDDPDARIYLGKSYFQKALIDFNKSNYLMAKKEFESALAYDRQCEKCPSYINQSLASYKEVHYNKGVAYYGKQQLEEAIKEWEAVYELDPGYKDVNQNLKKARELMDKLEQIKKSRQQ